MGTRRQSPAGIVVATPPNNHLPLHLSGSQPLLPRPSSSSRSVVAMLEGSGEGFVPIGSASTDAASPTGSLSRAASDGQLRLPPLRAADAKPIYFEDFYSRAKLRITKRVAKQRLDVHRASAHKVNQILHGRGGLKSTIRGEDILAEFYESVYPPLTNEEQDWARSTWSRMSPIDWGGKPAQTGTMSRTASKESVQSRASSKRAIDWDAVDALPSSDMLPTSSGRRQSVGGLLPHVPGLGSADALVHSMSETLGKIDLKEAIGHQKTGGSSLNGIEPTKLIVPYKRFLRPAQSELEADDLKKVLLHLGYMAAEEDINQALQETTKFSTLDFDEFTTFADRYVKIEYERLQKMFDEFDTDKSGQLRIDHLGILLQSIGITPLNRTLFEASQLVDVDQSGTFDFNEFCTLLAVYRITEGFTLTELQDLKKIFERFAVEQVEEPLSPLSVGTSSEKPPTKELTSESLEEALMYMFGPQSHKLAQRMVKIIMGSNETASDVPGVPPGITQAEPEVPQNVEFQEFLRIARTVREAEIEEYRAVFNDYEDEHGQLDKDACKQVVRAVGYLPLQDMIDDFMTQVDEDNSGTLDFSEFFNLMITFRITDGFTRKQVEDYFRVFACYDAEERNEVSSLQLRDMLTHLGFSVKIDEVKRWLADVDYNDNGTLDFREFLHLLRLRRENYLKALQHAFNKATGAGGAEHIQTAEASGGNSLQTEVSSIVEILEDVHGLETTEEDIEETLERLGTTASDLSFEDFVTVVDGVVRGSGSDLSFEDFVAVVDAVVRKNGNRLRQQAGFSDKEIANYRAMFEKYDWDSNQFVEGHELTSFLRDMCISINTPEEQAQVVVTLRQARNAAFAAGVPEEEIPSVTKITFPLLLHLLRMMQMKVEKEDVDDEDAAIEESKFTPKEAAEFREIFEFWSIKSMVLDDPECVPNDDLKFELQREEFTMEHLELLKAGGGSAFEFENLRITVNGVRRCLRALGIRTSGEAREQLEGEMQKLKSADKNTTIRFTDFLRILRWMLDTNFAGINDAAAQAATAAAGQVA